MSVLALARQRPSHPIEEVRHDRQASPTGAVDPGEERVGVTDVGLEEPDEFAFDFSLIESKVWRHRHDIVDRRERHVERCELPAAREEDPKLLDEFALCE